MHKVLVVTFAYPPVNTSGALRIAKFVKYLSDFDLEPIVLAPLREVTDRKGLPDELRIGKVVRTGFFNINFLFDMRPGRRPGEARAALYTSSDPTNYRASIRRTGYRIGIGAKKLWVRLTNFPDAAIGWYPYAIRAGLNLIERERVDLILSTSGPPTAHLVASRLSARTGRPWIADYRDLWNMDPYRGRRRGPLLESVEIRLERRILRRVDAVVTVSAPYAQILQDFLNCPVHVIENGYDHEDFVDYVSPLDQFTITYTGEINNPEKRNPEPLFAAMAQLIRSGAIREGDFRVRFFGNSCYLVRPLVHKYGIEPFVEVHPRVPYSESIARQRESAALLLLSWVDARAKGAYTAKVFEYLATGRPILAIGPTGGVIEDLLKETKGGILANEPTTIASVLLEWRSRFMQDGRLTGASLDRVGQYSRFEGTRKLSRICKELLRR